MTSSPRPLYCGLMRRWGFDLVLGTDSTTVSQGLGDVLSDIGYTFTTKEAEIPKGEWTPRLRPERAREWPIQMARAQATAIKCLVYKKRHPQVVLITVARLALSSTGEIIPLGGKSGNAEQVKRALLSVANKTITVLCGMVVTNLATAEKSEGMAEGLVTFGDITQDVADTISSCPSAATGDFLLINHPAMRPFVVNVENPSCVRGIPEAQLQSQLASALRSSAPSPAAWRKSKSQIILNVIPWMFLIAFATFTALLIVLWIDFQNSKTGASMPMHALFTTEGIFTVIYYQIHSQVHKHLEAYKSRLLTKVHGNVIEIGAGFGDNLRYLTSPNVTSIFAIEPNHLMHHELRYKAQELGIKINVVGKDAEVTTTLFELESIDTIVSTLVLCTVSSQDTVLENVYRWLKPGGRFVFIEHVAAEKGTWARTFQTMLAPLVCACGGGCHLTRETEKSIRLMQGMKVHHLEKFRLNAGPAFILDAIAGVAVKL